MNEEITSGRLTKQIILFRDFLVKSWGNLDKLMENHDWDEDDFFTLKWIQVNWEFLIERELLGKNKYLTPLSSPLTSRISSNNEKFDFSIITFSEENLINSIDKKIVLEGTRMRLIGFCSKDYDGFSVHPPFDFATFAIDRVRKEIVNFPLDKFKFILEPFNQIYFK